MAFGVAAWLIGLITGVFSGFFGVGGGVVSTPLIRLILDASPLIALGTPLPVILPSAISGGFKYSRLGFVDFEIARWGAITGIPATIGASLLTTRISGPNLMILTAIVIGAVGLDFASGARQRRLALNDGAPPRSRSMWLAVGAIVGSVSGLLGIGGGVVAVPLFVAWLRLGVKTAIGTSLFLVALIALPGSVVHYALGHVDLRLALFLTIGVIPGAWLGASLSARTSDARLLRVFGVFLLILSFTFGARELSSLDAGSPPDSDRMRIFRSR